MISEFSVESSGSNFPFGLQFQRLDAVARNAIDEVTWALEELVRGHGGRYDGWETAVMKR
jgi:hypothetical protein